MEKWLFHNESVSSLRKNVFASFVKKLISAGTVRLTESERRPIESINSLALITGTMVFVFGLTFYALVPSNRILYPVILEGLAFFSLILFNQVKWYQGANIGMYVIHCFSAIYFGATLGNALPVELVAAFLFVFLLGASLRIYKSKRERAVCALITVLLYLAVTANHHYSIIPPVHFEPTARLIISFGCIFGMVVLMLFVTFANMKENDLVIKEKDQLLSEKERLVEALKNADNNRTRFMWEISHELRTPLNASLGNAQLLHLRKSQFVGLPEYEEIISEINQLHVANCLTRDIINSVLDKAKIEAGQMEEMVKQPLDLQGLIEQSVGMNVLVANMRKVSILINETTLPFINGDKVVLLKILNNLISNAIKFTQTGSCIEIHALVADGQFIFSVTNQSTLTKERAEKIFDPFVSERHPFVDGTGLGLEITRRLIGILGGEIWVDTDEREKTSFLFRIPYEACPASGVPAEDMGIGILSLTGKEIVVIEDNIMNLSMLAKFIQKTGATPFCFEDAEIALSHIKARKPDLIISDAQMPVLSGRKMLSQLKASPELCLIPVIIVSGDLSGESTEEMKKAGANVYLTKPFIYKELQKAIYCCLSETADFHIVT
ncbi:response regulator [Chitinophaga barathri]|uniref:histidine kinase n=1 Tax=Chitinophaga barathri TaxID=1647451 RepID=A0A3N4MHR4_9BACT|nr:response regulator [Chitinophaga barathri]RPD43148.1 response regulator [Chitinophaga barathri]